MTVKCAFCGKDVLGKDIVFWIGWANCSNTCRDAIQVREALGDGCGIPGCTEPTMHRDGSICRNHSDELRRVLEKGGRRTEGSEHDT